MTHSSVDNQKLLFKAIISARAKSKITIMGALIIKKYILEDF